MKEILREAAFNPREDGPLKIIADTAISNPSYAEDRSVELIRDAQRNLKASAVNPEDAAKNVENYHRLMTQALGLLALARAVRA